MIDVSWFISLTLVIIVRDMKENNGKDVEFQVVSTLSHPVKDMKGNNEKDMKFQVVSRRLKKHVQMG